MFVWLVAVLASWVGVSLAYLAALRRVLQQRRQTLLNAMERVAARARLWQSAFEEVPHLEWRQAATSVGRALELLATGEGLKEKINACREMQRLVREGRQLVADNPSAFPPGTMDRAEELEAALDSMYASLAQYSRSAADACFVRDRFPLSIMARIVGLPAEGQLV